MRVRTTHGSPPHTPGRLSMPGKAPLRSRAAHCNTWAFSAGLILASNSSALSRTLIQISNLSPIDHVPPGLEVVGSAVLVFQIIGMFPHVRPEDRFVAFHDR